MSLVFGPPLPPLTPEESAALRAQMERDVVIPGSAKQRAYGRRWRKFCRTLGVGRRTGYAREAFLIDAGAVHRFDAEEAAR